MNSPKTSNLRGQRFLRLDAAHVAVDVDVDVGPPRRPADLGLLAHDERLEPPPRQELDIERAAVERPGLQRHRFVAGRRDQFAAEAQAAERRSPPRSGRESPPPPDRSAATASHGNPDAMAASRATLPQAAPRADGVSCTRRRSTEGEMGAAMQTRRMMAAAVRWRRAWRRSQDRARRPHGTRRPGRHLETEPGARASSRARSGSAWTSPGPAGPRRETPAWPAAKIPGSWRTGPRAAKKPRTRGSWWRRSGTRPCA